VEHYKIFPLLISFCHLAYELEHMPIPRLSARLRTYGLPSDARPRLLVRYGIAQALINNKLIIGH
jgi:hypothetical protein